MKLKPLKNNSDYQFLLLRYLMKNDIDCEINIGGKHRSMNFLCVNIIPLGRIKNAIVEGLKSVIRKQGNF